MAQAIAFFPWVYIEEPVTVGKIRLLPYVRGEAPGDQDHVSQADLDSIFSAYADRPNHQVSRATILELDEWRAGMDDDGMVERLFRAQNLLAFAALSRRRLFGGHFGYTNYDAYRLVVQRFQKDSPATFAFTTRRRDGGTSSLWSSEQFAFYRPLHVSADAPLEVNFRLLEALQRLADNERHMYEALVEFNCANTDSGSIQEHVEVVMTKSAFEWLLEINQNQKAFTNALEKFLPEFEGGATGPLKEKWRSRWQHASRPVIAWAQEFCALRGSAAHGKQREVDGFVLPYRSHLAFSAFFFPLIFMKVLAVNGLLTLDDIDAEKLRLMDSYIMYDPFIHDFAKGKQHPWSKLDSTAWISARSSIFGELSDNTYGSAED